MAVENVVRKGEFACNKQFLLFSQFFLPNIALHSHFKCTLKCRLQFVSIWINLKNLSSAKELITLKEKAFESIVESSISPVPVYFFLYPCQTWSFQLYLSLSQRTNFDFSKLKESADDNLKFNENSRKFSKWEENTVGKGEIACYKQFLLFPKCFP